MEKKTVASSAIWYHVSTWSPDSASRWAEGAARKGNYDGRRNISIIMFPADGIADAIGQDPLAGADLVLRRDTVYGTEACAISVAPAQVTGSLAGKYMSRSQAMELADRKLHFRATIKGETATIRIPGATLRELKAGNVNAFLFYQETDGTDSYCRLSTSAELALYVGNGWEEPVWTRSVSAGDVISNQISSHVADLRELEYYINIRRVDLGLTPMDDIGEEYDLGAFADWAEIVTAMQDAVDGILDADQLPAMTWTVPVTGQMPQADIVEQLKSTLEGGEDSGKLTADGFTGKMEKVSAVGIYDQDRLIDWEQAETLKAGEYSQTVSGGVEDWTGYHSYTTTSWYGASCGWIFDDLGQRTIAGATLDVVVRAANVEQPHLVLYGIKASEIPTRAKYSAVFHSEPIGEADADIGDITKIHLTSRGIQLINTGVIHGVGFRYDNDYVELVKTAALSTATLTENVGE